MTEEKHGGEKDGQRAVRERQEREAEASRQRQRDLQFGEHAKREGEAEEKGQRPA